MKSKTRLSGSLARLHDTRLVGGGCGLWPVVRRRAASLGLLLGYWATKDAIHGWTR
jgi:hypothetical protein